MKLELPNCTDNFLLQLIADDDTDAFTTLYRRYWEGLIVTTTKALRNKTEAIDIVQDVFLSLWLRRHEIKIESSVEAYLHSSVRYKAINYIEKQLVRRDYLAVLTDTWKNSLPATGEVTLQTKYIHELVHNAITKMPPKMQAVYKLSRQEHFSHKEIASQLGISSETVKKHIHNALALIKAALDDGKVSIPLALIFLLY